VQQSASACQLFVFLRHCAAVDIRRGWATQKLAFPARRQSVPMSPLRPVTLLVIGSPKVGREVKPVRKPRRNDPPWRPQRAIPQVDRQELIRCAQEWRDQSRLQVEEMLTEARLRLRAA
jgi:hypothetical protein